MKILNIYDEKDDTEEALLKITGDKKVVSGREDNQVIYKLFGDATWSNFYQLGMYNLVELQQLLELRKTNQNYDQDRHQEIISMLAYPAKQFELAIPAHWK